MSGYKIKHKGIFSWVLIFDGKTYYLPSKHDCEIKGLMLSMKKARQNRQMNKFKGGSSYAG